MKRAVPTDVLLLWPERDVNFVLKPLMRIVLALYSLLFAIQPALATDEQLSKVKDAFLFVPNIP